MVSSRDINRNCGSTATVTSASSSLATLLQMWTHLDTCLVSYMSTDISPPLHNCSLTQVSNCSLLKLWLALDSTHMHACVFAHTHEYMQTTGRTRNETSFRKHFLCSQDWCNYGYACMQVFIAHIYAPIFKTYKVITQDLYGYNKNKIGFS